MNSIFSALTVLSVLAVALAATPFKDCGSDGAQITNFQISGCTSAPCVFTKGLTATLEIEITTSRDFASLQNLIYGQIAGVNVPFSFPQGDACANGAPCPSKAGTVFKQSISVPVSTLYPSISLFVQFQLNDQDNKKVACALFPVKIQ